MPFCASVPCEELSGDPMQECGGCEEGAACRGGQATASQPAQGVTKGCMPHCIHACEELVGNVKHECARCDSSYACRPGAPGFEAETGAAAGAATVTFGEAAQSEASSTQHATDNGTSQPNEREDSRSLDAILERSATTPTTPSHIGPRVRFHLAASNFQQLVVDDTVVDRGGGYGFMSMHHSPPPRLPAREMVVEAGQVLFIPRGWWHWVASETHTRSVTLWRNHSSAQLECADCETEPRLLPARCAPAAECGAQQHFWQQNYMEEESYVRQPGLELWS